MSVGIWKSESSRKNGNCFGSAENQSNLFNDRIYFDDMDNNFPMSGNTYLTVLLQPGALSFKLTTHRGPLCLLIVTQHGYVRLIDPTTGTNNFRCISKYDSSS